MVFLSEGSAWQHPGSQGLAPASLERQRCGAQKAEAREGSGAPPPGPPRLPHPPDTTNPEPSLAELGCLLCGGCTLWVTPGSHPLQEHSGGLP